jgi:hypothetical protein
MIMPHELPDPVDDVVNRVKRRRPIRLGFEPLPETFNRIVLWRIGGQVCEYHPVVLGEKPLDGTALVNRGIIQKQDEQSLRKPLMALGQELQKELGRATRGALPIEALSAQMQGAKQGGTLTSRGGRHFDLVPLATPAALHVGFIGKMGFIDKQDFYGLLRLTDADGGDNFCHPGFFSRRSERRGGRFWRSVCRPSRQL